MLAASKGTVLYRLRKVAEVVSLAITLLAYGCQVQAIVMCLAWMSALSRTGHVAPDHVGDSFFGIEAG
jgi:hypothetical protein